jgi:hypothetical protein
LVVRVSEQLDGAGCSVEPIHGRAEAAAEHPTRDDRQLDGKLQQIRIEQHLVPVDLAAGVVVETTTFRTGIN